MLFRQLIDPATSTYTYLLADAETHEAVLIDPVREQVDRDLDIIKEMGLRLVATIETHAHADHITGAYLLRHRTGSQTIISAAAGIEGADREVNDRDVIRFGRHALEVRLTPGHTAGCASFVTDDLTKVFTGDALMIRGAGRTDFQQGDPRQLFHSVHDQILSLPSTTLVYPGHDYKGRTVSSVAEELAHNPRLGGGKTEDEFAAIMDNLNLAYPKRLDVSLPANVRAGFVDGDPTYTPKAQEIWSSVRRGITGVPHVATDWVQQNLGAFRIIDVRGADEFEGPLGHIDGAELVPLQTLATAASGWDRSAPLVLICRSSGRSDKAANALEQAGFSQVASMVGGMMAWRDAQMAVAK